MKCEKCGSLESKVISSRSDKHLNTQYIYNEEDTIYRRRECLNCKARFTTTEIKNSVLDNFTTEEQIKKLQLKIKKLKEILNG